MKIVTKYIVLGLIFTGKFVEALRCYSCSITSQNTDMKCLHDPVSVEGQSVVNCNKKYCTILRQELQDPAGKINTFVRGCEEKPILLNDVIDDPMFRTYYRSCSEDLCNAGDAIKNPSDQKISPDGYDGENLLVAGLPFNSSSISFVLIFWFVKNRFNYWKNQNVPFLQPKFPYGNIKGFGKNFHQFEFQQKIYEIYKKKLSPFVGLYYYIQPVVLCTDLEFIKNIFMRDSAYFLDRGAYYNEKDNPISAHLFNLDNPKWKILRNKLTPTFTSGKIKTMFFTLCDVGERLVKKLEKEVEIADDGILEMKEFSARFTTDVIGSFGFGIEINSLEHPDTEFRVRGSQVFEKPKYPPIFFQFCVNFKPLARMLKISTTAKEIEEFFTRIVKETIEYREKNQIIRNDFMNLLIQLKNFGKLEGDITSIGKLTLNEIVAQCFIFFAAGYETSSTTMAYALFELALNQNIQDKARDNVRKILSKYDGKFTYEGLMEMDYVDMCVNETLRKYPPVSFITRYCSNDYKIEHTEHVIKKGQLVIIPTYAIHHDKDIFPNPEVFDPERFSQLESPKIPQVAFMPFGHGARNCIGLRFGQIQAKVGLAMLLNNFKFELSDKTQNPLKFRKDTIVMLIAEGGIHLKVTKI
ncbi:hypothetical protein PVAND_015820 [Polypedilum vanderplanki]|uniref:Cytochrome P450 n=1 Tax=Polypedilum vanderplanki TaxID=319348 RepID=A0A9J6BEB2_POLVA|nr:hypothetical protein PVAND_015820 [Polypedilum vanderplanki]